MVRLETTFIQTADASPILFTFQYGQIRNLQ